MGIGGLCAIRMELYAVVIQPSQPSLYRWIYIFLAKPALGCSAPGDAQIGMGNNDGIQDR